MQKILLLFTLLSTILPTLANDAPFEFSPELDLVPITMETVDDLVLLDTWGRGFIQDSAWTGDGRYLRLASSTGVWQYDTANWSAQPELLMEAPMYMDYAVFGHSDYTFSPDAQTLFLTPTIVTEAHMPFEDPIAFNINTGEMLRRTYYEATQILSPDGTIVAHKNHSGYFPVSQFNRQTSAIYRLDEPIQYRDAHPTNEQPVTFSADNRMLVVRSALRDSDDVHLIFTDLENERREIGYFVNFIDAQYSLNNQVVGSLSQQRHHIMLLDGETLDELGIIQSEKPIVAYQLHPEGHMLVTMTEDDAVNFYDVSTLDLIYSERFDAMPWRKRDVKFNFSQDGQYLTFIHSEGGAVWDMSSFETMLTFDDFDYGGWYFWSQDHPTDLRRVEENRDATIISSRDILTDKTIVRRFSMPAPEFDIAHIVDFRRFLDDGSALFYGSGHPTIVVSFPGMKILESYEGQYITGIQSHPSQLWVITNGSSIHIWDEEKQDYIYPWSIYPEHLETDGCSNHAHDFDLSSDGKLLVYSHGIYACPVEIRLYRAEDDQVYATLPVSHSNDLLFSPNNAWVGINENKGLYLWDVDNPDNLIYLKGYEDSGEYQVFSLSFSDDSSMLIASTSYGVEFWDTERHILLHTLPRSNRQPMIMQDNVLITYASGTIQFWGVPS